MPLLVGIPISEEQCIGDSLDTINNAFLSLSGNLELSASNLLTMLRQTSGNLYSIIQATSASRLKIYTGVGSTFQMIPDHMDNIIFLDSNNPIQVVRSSSLAGEAHDYAKGHRTTFVQTGSGTVTFVGFNAYNFKYSMEGQYTQATVFFAGSAIEPINSGWIVTGDLVPSPQPLQSLQAAPIPGAEDPGNQLTLTGDQKDTIYYYPDPYGNVSHMFMNVYVNDIWRTTCDFTEERVGTEFGYRLIDVEPNTQGPQLSGIFAEGRVDIEFPGYGTPSTYYKLSGVNGVGNYPPDNGNSDPDNDIAYQTESYLFDGDTIFYLADPDPAGGGGGPTYTNIMISTNGGATYELRGRIDHEEDRVGQSFGYSRAGATAAPEVMGEFTDEGVVQFTLSPSFRPTPTPKPTSVPGATPSATPGPTRTPTPTPTPAPTGPVMRNSLVADVTPGSEDILHNISFVAEDAAYKDSIFYFPQVIDDFVMESPMIVYVNGVRRTAVTFPDDFTGQQFGYKLAGAATSEIQAYGTFAAGRVDLTIQGQISLVAATSPGTESPDYGISIVSENVAFNDTFYFYGIELEDYVLDSPMSIYVNGVRRTVVTFPDDFTGKQFGYRLKGATGSTGPQLYGTFKPGRVDLTAGTIPPTPTPTIGATPTPMPTLPLTNFTLRANKAPADGTDGVNQIKFTSLSAIYNDTITYKSDIITNFAQSTMTIRLSGKNRTTIQFPSSRLGKEFYYKLNPVLDDGDPGTALLTFATGLSDLSASAGWDWVAYSASLSAIASPGDEDVNDLLGIIRTNVAYNNDRIYYHPDNDPGSFTQALPMFVYYQGVHRATVDFSEERYGTAFGYSRAPYTSPEFYGVFASGPVAVSAVGIHG